MCQTIAVHHGCQAAKIHDCRWIEQRSKKQRQAEASLAPHQYGPDAEHKHWEGKRPGETGIHTTQNFSSGGIDGTDDTTDEGSSSGALAKEKGQDYNRDSQHKRQGLGDYLCIDKRYE
jgi:hypothetical protein